MPIHFRHLGGSILSALAWQTCREWAAHEPKRKDRVRRAQRGSSFSPHAIDEKTIASDSAWPPPPGSPHPPFTLHHQPWVLSGVQVPPWVPRSALLLQPNVTRLRRVNTLTPLSRTRGKLSLRSNKFSYEHKRGDLPIHKHAGAHETSSWTSFLLSSFRKNLPTN